MAAPAALGSRAAFLPAARAPGATSPSPPADDAQPGPINGVELRKRPEPKIRPPVPPRCDVVVARGTRAPTGDKIRSRIKVRVRMPNSAAYPAEGGRVSTL
ncbi:hypothetical protein MMARJ_09590 [Mycobacterium marseillense]|uniref:Uncharacterized protein n=1 Tax=Mycobacterium marseillense TaxID=701042 RepID=A0ABN5ZNK2_9MYCO|nr:hypothetical protein MMARJ_09590 [Mycobacterium marseillense]